MLLSPLTELEFASTQAFRGEVPLVSSQPDLATPGSLRSRGSSSRIARLEELAEQAWCPDEQLLWGLLGDWDL